MKRILLLASLTVFSTTVFAALPIYEPFADATGIGGTSYSVGAIVPGQNNGPLGATWSAAGPVGVDNTIAAGDLSIGGLSSSSGGSMEYGVSSGPSARLNLGSSFTSGSLYYSFGLKVTDLGSLGTSGGFAVAFNNSQGAQGTTPSVVTACLMMRSIAGQPGDFNIGVRKATGTPAWSPTTFHLNDVIFVVGSYTFNTGTTTDDVAKMWLNPDPLTFGGTTPADELVHDQAVADSTAIASLVFFRRGVAANQAATMFSDEIRVGTTWADVTPVPEPSSAALAIASGLVILALRRSRSPA
jgi:hypothetical protein